MGYGYIIDDVQYIIRETIKEEENAKMDYFHMLCI